RQGKDDIVVAREIVNPRAVGDGVDPRDAASCRQARPDSQPPAIATEGQGVHRSRNGLDGSRGSALVEVPEYNLALSPDRPEPIIASKRQRRYRRQRADWDRNTERASLARIPSPWSDFDVRR